MSPLTFGDYLFIAVCCLLGFALALAGRLIIKKRSFSEGMTLVLLGVGVASFGVSLTYLSHMHIAMPPYTGILGLMVVGSMVLVVAAAFLHLFLKISQFITRMKHE